MVFDSSPSDDEYYKATTVRYGLDTDSESQTETETSNDTFHSTEAMTDTTMAVDTTTPRRAKIKIGQPTPFDGAADKANRWLLSVDAYLHLNAHIYLTDEMKIIFALSFCTEGHASQWAESIYTKYSGEPYPEWLTFKTTFLNHFRSHDIEGEACLQLAQMRQGSDDIIAFNSKFSTVAYRANLDDDADIQYYMRTIKPAL